MWIRDERRKVVTRRLSESCSLPTFNVEAQRRIRAELTDDFPCGSRQIDYLPQV